MLNISLFRIMGKFVRKEKPQADLVLAATAKGAPKNAVKTTTFKAKSAINAKQAKVPNITKPKAALIVSTKTVQDEDVDVPKAVPITSPITPAAPQAPVVERHITKKEKIQNRRDNLMRKVDSALEAKRSVQLKAKAQKKLKRQSIKQVSKTTAQGVRSAIADMSQLKNALLSLDDDLPSLSSLFKLKSKELKTGVPKFDARAKRAAAEKIAGSKPPRKVSKTTNTLSKKQEFMDRYNYFQKLSNDKTFKANPRAVIAAHIRNRQAEHL